MKKKKRSHLVPILVCILALVIGTLIRFHFEGNVTFAKETIGDSTLYTKEEIQDAMKVVKSAFKKNFSGCKLTDLWYDEEQCNLQAPGWAMQYEAEEAIVLYSNYYVGPMGGDGSLNTNTTYDNWNWILVRSNHGKWELKTWGY